jgi:hypothetical protein
MAAFVALAAASCARVQFGSEFQEDGTAAHSVLVVFDRDDLDPETEQGVETRLTDVEEQAREDGLTVERIDTDHEVGVRISNPAADAADAGASLNALINAIALDELEGPVAPFQGTFTTESGAVGGAAFQLEMTVDGAVLMSVAEAMAPPGEELPTGEELSEALQMAYVAIMPGTIRDSNGQTIRPNTVRWDLPYDRRITMRAESKLGQEGSTTWFVIAAIGGVLVVAAIAGGIGVLLARRRRKAAAAARELQVDANEEVEQLSAQPETLSEAGSTLVRAVGRVVSGEEVASVLDQPDAAPDDEPSEG